MLEKEIKILEIDVWELTKKLESLWAKKVFLWDIHDVYYDFPDTIEDKLQANGRMFRVRQKWSEHIYTIKNKRKEIKKAEKLIAKDEYEKHITNIESFQKVIEKYGMKKIREKKKHRISYVLDGVTFDIDDYQNGIPPLLEIEAWDKKTITHWQEKLWLEKHTVLLWGSRKLFKYYRVAYTYLDL